MTDNQNTSLQEDLNRVKLAWEEVKQKPFGQSKRDDKRINLFYLTHSLMNLAVEATRRDAQKWTKIYLSIILVLYGLCVWGFVT